MWLKYVIGGIFIGSANVVPGVSGGTVAVVLGLYEKIIAALSIKTLVRKFKSTFLFFAALACGAAVGILLVARGIEWTLARYPLLGVSFFIGLIIGGVPQLVGHYRAYRFHFYDLALFALGMGIALLPFVFDIDVSESISATNEVSNVMLLISGFVAAITMVLPGISGSLALIELGSYAYILNAITSLNVPVLLLFALGVVVGIFTCAKMMRALLKKVPRETWALILGLVIGSIIFLWPSIPERFGYGLLMVGLFLVGVIPSYLLSRTSTRR